ncbi:MAG: acyltransferase [Lautropia sp.]|nr:acyltransferase [Lautropia sp.]
MQSISQPSKTAQFSLPLHGLRGIAVLIVLFSHLGNAAMPLAPIPHDAIGKVGVWIFFSLSSFLLTRALYRSVSREASWWQPLVSYGVHRVFRIYPLYVAVLLLHWLLGELSAADVSRHLMLQQGEAELWAIPVEFKYYLVVPLVALAAQHVPVRWVSACLLGLLLLSLGYGVFHPVAVFSVELDLLPKLSPFLMGSLLALHVDQLMSASEGHGAREGWTRHLLSLRGQIMVWGFFLSISVLFRAMIKADVTYQLAPLIAVLIAAATVALILVSLHACTWTASFLRARVLVFFGEISFSLYLLHMFFVHAMERWGNAIPVFLQGWLVMAVCIPVSMLTYRYIERPGIQAGKYLGDKLNFAASRRCLSS